MFRKTIFLSLFLVNGLSACSGGELLGINSHPAPATPNPKTTASAAPASPIASPTAPSTESVASVSGEVVDFDTNQPLAGVQIQLRPIAATSYSAVATSESNGAFTFSTEPGSYVIAVGSNSTNDTTRATEHDAITLAAGKNVLSPIEPMAVPNYTLMPSQSSGNFRLASLSSSEQSCLSGMNTGRAANSLPLLVEDEEELEYDRAELAEELAQNTDQPSPMLSNGEMAFEKPDGLINVATYSGLTPCSSYSDGYTFGNGVTEQSAYAYDAGTVWYAGDAGSSGSNIYEVESWGIDQIANSGGASNAAASNTR